jgi:hypothetical protein
MRRVAISFYISTQFSIASFGITLKHLKIVEIENEIYCGCGHKTHTLFGYISVTQNGHFT